MNIKIMLTNTSQVGKNIPQNHAQKYKRRQDTKFQPKIQFQRVHYHHHRKQWPHCNFTNKTGSS